MSKREEIIKRLTNLYLTIFDLKGIHNEVDIEFVFYNKK